MKIIFALFAFLLIAAAPFRAVDSSSFSGTIDGVDATVARDGIRIKNAQGVTIRNFNLRHVAEPSVSPNLPEGISIYAGDNVQILDGTVSGFLMTRAANEYWNGDGVAIERPVTRLTIRNVTSNDNTDAGFDIKPPVTMDQVSASGNCRGFRFWTSATVGTMTLGDTVRRGGNSSCMGVWINGGTTPPSITIAKLIVRMTKPTTIIQADAPAIITIKACDIEVPEGKVRFKVPTGSKLTLGPGC